MPLKNLGGGEARTGFVGVPPRRRGQSGSTQPPGRAMLSWKRGGLEHAGGHVSLTAAAAVLANANDFEDGFTPPWHPDDEHPPEVLFDVVSSRSALSGPGNDGERFVRLQSIIDIDIGRDGA